MAGGNNCCFKNRTAIFIVQYMLLIKKCMKSNIKKRIDLSIDSISAASDIPKLPGVAVAAASGRIIFYYLHNSEDVYCNIHFFQTVIARFPMIN